jgi:cell wall-associated NlpC family hydrolase
LGLLRPLLIACVLAIAAHGAYAQQRYEQAVQGDSGLDSLIRQIETRTKEAVQSASDVSLNALALLGVNYRFGGNAADTGLDCSGLVRLVFKETFGLVLPRRADEISRVGDKVKKDELKPGDLVFFNTLRRAFSHVGIYIGEGKFVHAPSTGGQVRVENLQTAYWSTRFNGARRIEPAGGTPVATPAAEPVPVAAAKPAPYPERLLNERSTEGKASTLVAN